MFFPVIIGRGGGAGGGTAAVAAHASGTGVHPIAAVTGLQAALDVKADQGSNLITIPTSYSAFNHSAVTTAIEANGSVTRIWVDLSESVQCRMSLQISTNAGQPGQVADWQYATAAAPSSWNNFGTTIALDQSTNTGYNSAWVDTPAGAIAESVLNGGVWVRMYITAPTGGASTPSNVSLRNIMFRNRTLGHDGADGEPGPAGTTCSLAWDFYQTTGNTNLAPFGPGSDRAVRLTSLHARTYGGACTIAFNRRETTGSARVPIVRASGAGTTFNIDTTARDFTLAADQNVAAWGDFDITVTVTGGVALAGFYIGFAAVAV